ncbi:hypothetical protein FOA43_001454 [Brettanomyces nanus]|uniref:dolichol kinase n=1 Tax=Eeniella nana TaxID=13502 RepID=A0A875S217_EENNA|nr:uncharacterized protein FOA43_001454 [Brettanomyces nanus]QPG74132.1 hypothetical protein FOA43_001454 [Brettanomyces nanus]
MSACEQKGQESKTEAEARDIEDDDLESDELRSAYSYYTDLLDESIKLPNVIQLMVIFFIANMMFIYYTQKIDQDNGESDPMWPFIYGGLAVITALVEVIMLCIISYRNYKAKVNGAEDEEEKKAISKPQLPEFSLIYSIFVPLTVTLMYFPSKMPVIIACIVQVPYMNPIVRILVSYVAMYQIGSGPYTITFYEMLSTPIVFASSYTLLEHFIASSLSVTERSMFSYLVVALLVFADESTCDISLVIFQKLVLAFGISLALTSCLVGFYKSRQQGTLLKKVTLLLIYVVFIGSGFTLSYRFLKPILGKAPWFWIAEYIAQDAVKSTIFKAWITSSVVLVPSILYLAKKIPFGFRRKIWHFVTLTALGYPITVEPQLTSLALVGLFCIFAIVELIRANNLPPFGGFIRKILIPFQDRKDTEGAYVLSYLFLVLGVALPLWLSNCTGTQGSVIGLVVLGLGDSFASLIGKSMGQLYWPEASKTIEGSFFFFFFTAFALYTYQNVGENSYDNYSLLLTPVITAILEGNMSMNDNVVVPVIGLICLDLIQQVRY